MGKIDREKVKALLTRKQDKLSYNDLIKKTGWSFEDLKELYNEIFEEGGACIGEEVQLKMAKANKRFEHLGRTNTGYACIRYKPRVKSYSLVINKKSLHAPTLEDALRLRENLRNEIIANDSDYRRDYEMSEVWEVKNEGT